MSGHSKWANIKNKKEKTDSQRGKVFTKIGRELHVLSRFEKQLNKLPHCAAALAAECETLDAFHRRRLSWAERKLKLDDKPITQSALYRTACLRKLQI